MAEFEPSEQFASFFFLAIDHAFASIEDEIGPLIPFVMFVDRAGDRTLQRFVAEQLEEAVEQAHGFILENQSAWQMYALAWDGFITIEGKRTDGTRPPGRDSAGTGSCPAPARAQRRKIVARAACSALAPTGAGIVVFAPCRTTCTRSFGELVATTILRSGKR